MPKQSWTIGSDPKCDLVVDNATVSGRHCRLEQVNGSFKLEDLKSSNGTFVNGQRLEDSTAVSRKDRITLGRTLAMPWPAISDNAKMKVITIGRSPKNVLVINETNVSSVHAQLTISDHEIVLEDLGSTNGTSVGTVENKINRVTVQAGDTIFLGSISYVVSDLISRANLDSSSVESKVSVAPKEIPIDAEKPDREKTSRQNLGMPAKIGLASVAAILLAATLWMVLPGGDADSNEDDLVASTGQTTNEANSNGGDPDSGLTKSPAIETRERENGVAAKTEPIELTDSERLSHSLFLLVCSDQEQKIHFRVGTGFAVDSKHVATSASAISIIQDLQKNGFPNVYLYHPASKQDIEIVSTRVHPRYETANTEARRAQQEHDGIMDDLESQPPSPDSFEAVKEQLLAARLKAIESLELKTTCDVGIVEVRLPLEHWLEGIDPATALRPKLKLSVTGFAYDIEDPYFDVSFPVKMSTMTSRVKQLSQWSNDSLQRLEATGSPTQMEYSYLGSPALNDQGQVVAVYSRPLPPGNVPGESSETSEPKAVAEFDAPLFLRVRECLENRRP